MAASTSWKVFLELLPQLEPRFDFALWGARALAAHGAVRDTTDVDLVFTEKSRAVLGLFREHGLRVAHFATDHFLVSHEQATSIEDHIDVFFPLIEPAQSAALRPMKLVLEGVPIPVARPAALVAAKLMASSSLQNGDAWLALDAGITTVKDVSRELDRVNNLARNPDRMRRQLEDVAGARHRLALWKRFGTRSSETEEAG